MHTPWPASTPLVNDEFRESLSILDLGIIMGRMLLGLCHSKSVETNSKEQ